MSDIMRPADGGPTRYDAWVATIGFEVFSYDPDMLFRGWWGGWAEGAGFSTAGVPSKLNLLLDAALEEPDIDKQNQLYAQANEILLTEAGSVPILFQPIVHARHKSVADAPDTGHDALRGPSVRGVAAGQSSQEG